ncbi:MAG TPA: YraN family protein [Ohtaekwangia sp.]|nr:YraN family protein [Ohtaekwangia sp.]
MSNKIETGNQGETLAARYLKEKGYEILARNYRHGKAEIDLIVQKDNWVLFVEVKTRKSSDYGQPEDFVMTQQAGRIFDAAEEWIFSTNWQGHIRFDVVSVKPGETPEIEHFEDAIN